MSTGSRLDIDEYFMAQAIMISARSTCDRARVGCVITHQNKIVAAGYNGSPRGLEHCDIAGHSIAIIDHRPTCVRSVHAEQNAIMQLRDTYEDNSLSMYCTHSPCITCAKMILNLRLNYFFYRHVYILEVLNWFQHHAWFGKVEHVGSPFLEEIESCVRRQLSNPETSRQ